MILAVLALVAVACDQGGAANTPVEATSAPGLQLTGRVVDDANLLDPADEQALAERLAKLEQETTDQIVVVTVSSLEGQKIEKYAFDLANRWQIGRADVDNGVLIVVAPSERKVRIEVGKGLEGLLTDAKASLVIKAMIPRFKTGDYAGGVSIGADRIDQLLRSDRRRPRPKPISERTAD